MIDDGRQVCFGNFGEHFAHGTTDVIFRALLGCWATMQCLSCRIALNLLLDPIFSIADPGLAEPRLFVVFVSELAASKVDDLEGKMVSNTMDMMGELLGVCVGFVLRLCLPYGQYTSMLNLCYHDPPKQHAHRDSVDDTAPCTTQ